jgi:hypothetical protein
MIVPYPFFLTEWTKSSLERLSEKSRRRLQLALRTAEKFPFGPFRPPYTGQIHGRSFARTPFRTVSEEVFSEVRIAPVQETPERAGPGSAALEYLRVLSRLP